MADGFSKVETDCQSQFYKNSPLQNELQSRPALEIGVSSKLRRKTKDKKLKKKKVFSLSPMSNNFVNHKRDIFTATPLSTKQKKKKRHFQTQSFPQFNKRACSYLKFDPTFVDEWHSEISTSYQQKKRWADDWTTCRRTDWTDSVCWQDHR